jgi:hypothetical protein
MGHDIPEPQKRTYPLKRLLFIVLLSWIAVIGVDFFLSAGLFSKLFIEQSPFLLPPEQSFRLIPVGYLAFLVFICPPRQMALVLGRNHRAESPTAPQYRRALRSCEQRNSPRCDRGGENSPPHAAALATPAKHPRFLFNMLFEPGDFIMMRKQMLGIRSRAESGS